MRARRVSVWLCAMIALVAVSGACVFYPAAVFAASGTVSQETPLYDSADPAAPAIALLPEGTIVSIDGPPVAEFYPVTAGDQFGWMRGETLQLEKDRSESDPAEEMAADAPRDEMDETVPGKRRRTSDPARSTTVEPATDPAVDSQERRGHPLLCQWMRRWHPSRLSRTTSLLCQPLLMGQPQQTPPRSRWQRLLPSGRQAS